MDKPLTAAAKHVRMRHGRRLRYTGTMPLYFAYGTNMDRAGMRRRCPGAAALGTGILVGWRLFVMRAGYVSIARAPAARVHGVLWRLGARDLAVLDRYEGVDAGLYRRAALRVTARGRIASAEVYIGCSEAPGRARPGHLAAVLAAGQSWNLPADYLDEVRRWAEAR
jgi:gamma-glutamylcyclotransferase (GGCT)/AIG2-like uncharacterized protein YtfP